MVPMTGHNPSPNPDLVDERPGAYIGMGLTESLAMTPAASVCGFYLAHPDCRYFNVGPIGRDQLADQARRRHLSEDELARWLAPNL